MADSIAAQSSILSAICKAKADTKDGADGSGWDKGESNGVSISTFLSSDVSKYYFITLSCMYGEIPLNRLNSLVSTLEILCRCSEVTRESLCITQYSCSSDTPMLRPASCNKS
jgi:hypothetical protein